MVGVVQQGDVAGSECQWHVCSPGSPPPGDPACHAHLLVASGSGGHPAAVSRLEHQDGKTVNSLFSSRPFLQSEHCAVCMCLSLCVFMIQNDPNPHHL